LAQGEGKTRGSVENQEKKKKKASRLFPRKKEREGILHNPYVRKRQPQKNVEATSTQKKKKKRPPSTHKEEEKKGGGETHQFEPRKKKKVTKKFRAKREGGKKGERKSPLQIFWGEKEGGGRKGRGVFKALSTSCQEKEGQSTFQEKEKRRKKGVAIASAASTAKKGKRRREEGEEKIHLVVHDFARRKKRPSQKGVTSAQKREKGKRKEIT